MLQQLRLNGKQTGKSYHKPALREESAPMHENTGQWFIYLIRSENCPKN